MDGILREDKPQGTFLVGYADEIAAIITARNTEEAQRKLRRVILSFLRPRPVHA